MYLQGRGAEVERFEDPRLAAFRRQHGVPIEAWSCHTALLNGYVIEGHVPVDAILRLLEERPDAVGLALPGMPADAPGMADADELSEAQPVMLIASGGGLVPFSY